MAAASIYNVNSSFLNRWLYFDIHHKEEEEEKETFFFGIALIKSDLEEWIIFGECGSEWKETNVTVGR